MKNNFMGSIAIIDGNNLIHKSFHGVQPLSTKSGIPVNAVYGSLKTIKNIIVELKPDYIIVVFDSGKKTFRSDLDKNYKSHRPPIKQELKLQFPLLQEALSCLGIPYIISLNDAEGDDTTGTIAVQSANIGLETIIVSSDKDFFQLCDNELIKVYSYVQAKKTPHNPLIDKEFIKNNYSVEPKQLVDVKSLVGEKTDNIMGVPGIGPKTATALIQKYKTVHNLLKYLKKNPDDKYYFIYKHKDVVELALQLAIIKTDVELNEIPVLPVDKIKIDEEKLKEFFIKLEMNSFLKENFPYWKNIWNYKCKVGNK